MITFHQDCTVFEVVRDGWGNPIKKSEQHLKCRAKEKYQLVKDNASKEVLSQLEFTLPPEANVKVDFKIDYEGKEHTIISLKVTRNTIGAVVKKVVYV